MVQSLYAGYPSNSGYLGNQTYLGYTGGGTLHLKSFTYSIPFSLSSSRVKGHSKIFSYSLLFSRTLKKKISKNRAFSIPLSLLKKRQFLKVVKHELLFLTEGKDQRKIRTSRSFLINYTSNPSSKRYNLRTMISLVLMDLQVFPERLVFKNYLLSLSSSVKKEGFILRQSMISFNNSFLKKIEKYPVVLLLPLSFVKNKLPNIVATLSILFSFSKDQKLLSQKRYSNLVLHEGYKKGLQVERPLGNLSLGLDYKIPYVHRLREVIFELPLTPIFKRFYQKIFRYGIHHVLSNVDLVQGNGYALSESQELLIQGSSDIVIDEHINEIEYHLEFLYYLELSLTDQRVKI